MLPRPQVETVHNSPLRVAFYLDRPHRLMGGQRQLQMFLKWARPAGLEAVAAAPMGGICVDALRNDGIPVDIIPAPERLRQYDKELLRLSRLEWIGIWLRDVLPHARQVADWARAHKAQILHFNSPRGIVAAGYGARRPGLRSVLHLRGSMNYFDGLLGSLTQALADRILLNAEALRTEIAPTFSDRCVAIHDGAEEPQRWTRREARTTLGAKLGLSLGERERLVLCLSSLVPFKGQHHLIDAMAKLRDLAPERPTWLVLAGGGEERYRRYLEEQVSRLGLDNVRMLGYFPDPELLTVAADVVVLPTIDNTSFVHLDGERVAVRSTEGFPQTILEALAAGVPVVATRVAGTPEQVRDGETGLLVPQADSSALAGAIGRIVRDDALRTRMGQAARADARARFHAPTQAVRTLDILRSVAV
jgi:glycosyltransferase involved in cell wall biosynthesis